MNTNAHTVHLVREQRLPDVATMRARAIREEVA